MNADEDFADVLTDHVPETTRPRGGLVANTGNIPCRQCGQVHPYLTGSLTVGEETVCGIPVLWADPWTAPPSLTVVDPPHGLQVLLMAQAGPRLAIVWRVDGLEER